MKNQSVSITHLNRVPAFEGGFVDTDDADFDDVGLGEAEGKKNNGAKQEADDEGFEIDGFHSSEICHRWWALSNRRGEFDSLAKGR